MQRKWLLEYEVAEAKRIARSKAPRKNKNQEKEVAQERLLTEEDKQHIRSYSVLMPLASVSVKKLDKIIKKASTTDIRDSGIGNFGGHIAREFKLPGPLNGKKVYEQESGCVTSPFYVKLKKRGLKLETSNDDSLNPPWDQNFVNDHNDRNKEERPKDEEYLLLKLEMHSFLSRNIDSHHDPADHSVSVDSSTSSFASRSSPAKHVFPGPLNEEVVHEWSEMRKELEKLSSDIKTNDLMEISSWVKPPPAAVDILGYLCTLLGINPDWLTAKRLILRNIPALQNFIRKVEPRHLPLSRLLEACDWREAHIPVLSHVGMQKVNQALSKLTRWVLYFNRMVTFFKCSHEGMESDSVSNSVLTQIKLKKAKTEAESKFQKKGSERALKRGHSKRSTVGISRNRSSNDLDRLESSSNISRSESKTVGEKSEQSAKEPNVNMHELIKRNSSMSKEKETDDRIPRVGDIDFAAAARSYDAESRPTSQDPILGSRRVSVISKILNEDATRRASILPASASDPRSNVAVSSAAHSNVKDPNGERHKPPSENLNENGNGKHIITTQDLKNSEEPDLELQFWKSIGAAFMLDDVGNIILSNGKDISLYQDMLLSDETITSDYSKRKLSGGDLALTARRRKMVAANKDMIHNFVGTLIRQVSDEYTEKKSQRF